MVEESFAGLAGPAGDPEALAANVLALYRLSQSERRAMGLRGRAYFEQHFEPERLLDRLEELMREVKGRNQEGSRPSPGMYPGLLNLNGF